MDTTSALRAILNDTLQLGNRADNLHADSPLFGAIPEFDSMAVVTVVTGIEEQFGIVIDDEDLTEETFATMGSLSSFVDRKRAEQQVGAE